MNRVIWDDGSIASRQWMILACIKRPDMFKEVRAVSMCSSLSVAPPRNLGRADLMEDGEEDPLPVTEIPSANHHPIVAWNKYVRRAAPSLSSDLYWMQSLRQPSRLSTWVHDQPPEDWRTAEGTLLLALLPKLDTIQLRVRDKGLQEHISVFRLFELASQDSTLLPNLRRVSIAVEKPRSETFGHSQMAVEHILRLVQVKEFDMSGLWKRDDWQNIRYPNKDPLPCFWLRPGASGIEHLTLKNWDGSSALLAQLVRSCKLLRTFDLHMDDNPSWSYSMFRYVIPELSLHKDTLERSVLDIDMTGPRSIWDDHLLPIGSFKDFKIVKHIQVPDQLMIGQSRLALPDLFGDMQEHYDIDFVIALRKYVREKMKVRGVRRCQLPEEGMKFGQHADWITLTDIFPPQLEKLIISISPHGPREEHYFLPSWFEHFVPNVRQRLPKLRYLDVGGREGPEYQVRMFDRIGRYTPECKWWL